MRLGSHGDSKAVLRFLEPSEVKGVALLIVNHPDRASDQWMWTPALQRERRIALQDRSTRFFGTDFSFEDLEERDVNQYDYRLLGEQTIDGAACWRIESVPAQKKISQYTRSEVWIRKDNYAFAQVENFIKSDLVRRLKYTDLAQVQGIWTGAPAGDVRPPPEQPDHSDAREAAIQHPAQRGRLHPAGPSEPSVIDRVAAGLGCAPADAVAGRCGRAGLHLPGLLRVPGHGVSAGHAPRMTIDWRWKGHVRFEPGVQAGRVADARLLSWRRGSTIWSRSSAHGARLQRSRRRSGRRFPSVRRARRYAKAG